MHRFSLDSDANIGMENGDLKEFLDIIEWNTSYHYCIEGGNLKGTHPITLKYDGPISTMIEKAFEGQPYQYFFAKNYIVVVKTNDLKDADIRTTEKTPRLDSIGIQLLITLKSTL